MHGKLVKGCCEDSLSDAVNNDLRHTRYTVSAGGTGHLLPCVGDDGVKPRRRTVGQLQVSPCTQRIEIEQQHHLHSGALAVSHIQRNSVGSERCRAC